MIRCFSFFFEVALFLLTTSRKYGSSRYG